MNGTLVIQCYQLQKNTHVGVDRFSNQTKKSLTEFERRISIARGTSYTLLSCGLHGTNGLNPLVSMKIYQTYILPRLLYGLESVILKKSEIDELSSYHKNFLRRIQGLYQPILPLKLSICL